MRAKVVELLLNVRIAVRVNYRNRDSRSRVTSTEEGGRVVDSGTFLTGCSKSNSNRSAAAVR